MSNNHVMVEVIFRVEARLSFGEDVRVSGNVPALGCNDESRAVRLYTTSHEYPVWTTKTSLYLPRDNDIATNLEYRYSIFSGGKFLRYESDSFRKLDFENWTHVEYTNDIFGRPDIETSNTHFQLKMAASQGSSSSKAKWGNKMHKEKLANWGRRQQVTTLSSQDGIIIVSYFLPVFLKKLGPGEWEAKFDEENVLALTNTNLRISWVGSPRYSYCIAPEEEEAVARVLNRIGCYPVFINSTMHHQFYDVFCKQQIWPILHHVTNVYGAQNTTGSDATEQQDVWFTFATVTRLFRDKVVEIYQGKDLVWVHGFHLMSLPSFLRRLIPLAKIGLFIHTPFPSSEIWRSLTRRVDLLRGMLAADQVGFHLYEYARHFLTTCRRLLGHTYGMNANGTLAVQVDGREVAITCIHVGIDLPRVDVHTQSLFFKTQSTFWKQRFAGKVVVAGIDRMEKLKGIPLKLLAIEQFLQENPAWSGKIVFPIIGISALERGDDYRQTQKDVTFLMKRINAQFPEAVYFDERTEASMNLAERLAFLACVNVLMIASARDGLNRMPMEFTLARAAYAKLIRSPEDIPTDVSSVGGLTDPCLLAQDGVLIISEFVSSARVMRGGLVVNPWRRNELVRALDTALNMPMVERADRMRRNLEFSTRLTTVNWAAQVLKDLKAVEKSSDYTEYSQLGLGVGFRVMGLKTGFKSVDVPDLCRSYRSARRRLVLLDLGGTLVAESEKNDAMAAYAIAKGHATRSGPGKDVKQRLTALASDPKV
jgi:trehalose 6-phosphate synthase/phosphatase